MQLEFIAEETVTSTNDRLFELADRGAACGTVLTAVTQTAGRGRQDRHFQSDRGGLYMSLLLRPSDDAPFFSLTGAAAVAAAEAVRAEFSVSPKIKWVNDLYLDGRKICGILTERRGGAVVVGIGINVWRPHGGFDGALSGRAGSIFDFDAPPDFRDTLQRLAEAVARGITGLWPHGGDILERYRRLDMLKGRPVAFTQDGRERTGTAAGIADDFSLIVDTKQGSLHLAAGEVRLTDF